MREAGVRKGIHATVVVVVVGNLKVTRAVSRCLIVLASRSRTTSHTANIDVRKSMHIKVTWDYVQNLYHRIST